MSGSGKHYLWHHFVLTHHRLLHKNLEKESICWLPANRPATVASFDVRGMSHTFASICSINIWSSRGAKLEVELTWCTTIVMWTLLVQGGRPLTGWKWYFLSGQEDKESKKSIPPGTDEVTGARFW